jgi:hypothetical protein
MGPHYAGAFDRQPPSSPTRPISACNTASCRRSTTSPPDPHRPRAVQGLGAPVRAGEGIQSRLSMPGLFAEQQAAPTLISRPSSSESRRSAPTRSRLHCVNQAQMGAWSTNAPPRRAAKAASRRSRRTAIMGFREDVSIRDQGRRRGFARRYPLRLALFRKRSRQQRRARHQADRGHQHRGRTPTPSRPSRSRGAGESAGQDGEEAVARESRRRAPGPVGNRNSPTVARPNSSLDARKPRPRILQTT